MSPNRRNILVGIVVLVSLGVLGWMVLAFAGRVSNFLLTKGTHVQLTAKRADGISEGSAVVYLGVNVGRVQSIGLAPGGNGVRANLIIDQGQQIPANVQGTIQGGGLLGGGAAVSLEPIGEPSTEMLREGTELVAVPAPGGLIPPEFTALAKDVRDRELIRHLDETVLSMKAQAEKVGETVESMNKLLNDKQMREDLAKSLASIRSASEKADRLGTEFEKVTGGLNGTTKKLNDRIDQVGVTLTHFEELAARVNKGEGTLGMLANDPRLYQSLADTAAELNLTIATLKRLVEQWEEDGVSFNLK